MNTKKLFYLIAASLFLGSLFFTSCNKDETQGLDEDITATQDNSDVERIFNNVSNIADEAYNMGSSYKSGLDEGDLIGGCATITFDTSSFPKVITIDFGDENCLCPDGRYRRGKIIVTFTGPYRQPGTVITHTFASYFVNDNQVLGSKVVTNAGRNENNNLYYIIEVVGQIIKANGNGEIYWSSFREREWIAGEDTFYRLDDVYLITGTASGTSTGGFSFTMVITNPLRKEIGCRHMVSGTFEFTPGNRSVRILDYGDGECDNIATITVNGVTRTIYLR